MVLKGVRRVVRRAEQGDVRALDQAAHTHTVLLELGIAERPHLLGSVLVENARVAKIAL